MKDSSIAADILQMKQLSLFVHTYVQITETVTEEIESSLPATPHLKKRGGHQHLMTFLILFHYLTTIS